MTMTADYPHLDRNEYFSPNCIIGEDFGLNYDYHTGIEKNFTYGSYRISATRGDYAEIRQMIESLPEIKSQYELRALCCVPWDDAGTSIAFALAKKGNPQLLPATPFASMDYGDVQFYARNPRSLVADLVKKPITAHGKLMSYGQYLLLNKDKQK